MEDNKNQSDFEFPLVDMSLLQLLEEVWNCRFFIIAGALIGLLSAIGFLMVVTPKYQAQMIVAPASPLSSVVDSSAHSDDAFLLFMNLCAGPSLAKKVMESGKNRLIDGLRKDKPFFLAPSPIDTNASPEELSAYLRRNISTSKIGDTSLQRLSYSNPDPYFAVEVLNSIHNKTDEMIRASSKTSSAGRIEYLENELSRIHNADHRRALTNLLMEQEYIYMLTTMDEPFAARVIEPPYASIRPIWPRKGPSILIFVAIGMMGGFVLKVYLGMKSKVTS